MTHNVLSYLAISAGNTPEYRAISDAKSSLTYGQLKSSACRIGNSLRQFIGQKQRQPVFVCIDRTVETVAAFYGVLCSGNFYVPIDLSLPEKRLLDIYNTMQPAAILMTGSVQRTVPFPQELLLSWEQAIAGGEDDALFMETIRTGIDTDPLYCIFTSGSTGVPKGVLISHRSVIDMAEQFTEVFKFDSSCVFGNQAPFDFDVSVKDLYLALKNGASVEILETSLFMMPKRLIERLNSRGVNTLVWAAAAMKILSALHTFQKCVPQSLRWVLFSGELLPCKVLNDWMTHMPATRFANVYGPTEITCNCTYYIIDRAFSDEDAIPIGSAFCNSDVFLLGDGNCITAPDEIGEICVRGTCLALGYYGNPEKTAQAFCQNPLQSAYPERIYRTGDLGKYAQDGSLYFVGRADSQVKYMGHRIELGEIEIAANALEQVDYACCLFDSAHERLCIFYQAQTQEDKKLLHCLKQVLPDWMLPNRVFYLETMPVNRTGKIDRVFLQKSYIEKSDDHG